ncbi:centrosomal protein of 112 kDa [Nelusetta ayraudi]|uniref:centrosomal protein of 112 kDa n=1 Tax=Nelusetta ayraudi TaxID=303726 RepID=UPI003F6F934E
MSKHEDCYEKLDCEFDHLLLDMKPFVLKHPSRTDRQRCALWIKKLCDPATGGSGLRGRKNRNMYARLLLHMLERGTLELPFSSKPEPGSLKTLPTYMSIYFDESLPGPRLEPNSEGLPDWVTGELNDDSLRYSQLKTRPSSTPVRASHRRRPCEEMSPVRHGSVKQSPRRDDGKVSEGLQADASLLDDSDLEARLNRWNLGIENPRYLREKPVPFTSVLRSSFERNSSSVDDEGPQLLGSQELHTTSDVKLRLLEAKHQEEKLMMQQRHDADVEKILERKNGEIEETKNVYRAKQKESEETIHKLERKVQCVLRESQVIHESKEKQIAELKKMLEQSADSLTNECEKKLHAAVAAVEQEKFEMQKKHTENIQELLEDTNGRLAKMEAEYNARSQATEQTLRELELRVRQQSAEAEKGNALRQRLTQEKAQLEIQVTSIGAELQEAKRRYLVLQKEKEQERDQHEQNVQRLSAKHEMDMSHLNQEHALSAAKATEVMEEFEKTIAQLQLQLLDDEHQRHQQVRDQEMKFQQQKDRLQISLEKKVLAVHNEAEKERTDAKMKIAKLEDALREMEAQLDRARESQRQQIQQADAALEQLKKQVELSSERTYSEMKHQMEKVEEDLTRSKSVRERQAKDFSEQLDALRHKYEQQMAEQRVQLEQERTRLQQQHSAEKDSLVQERQREVLSLERQAKATLQQHQQHTQEWRKRDGQRIADLEEQLAGVCEELRAARAHHKQQLAEMVKLREEERQRALLDREAQQEQVQQHRRDLERSHQQEREAQQEKANSRLKQVEREYGQKLAKSAQLIAELQTSVCDSKEETVRLQQAMEKRLKETSDRWDGERRRMSADANQAMKVLREKVDRQQRHLHDSEKKLLSKELQSEEKVTAVRQGYEDRIKGLMPAALRQELEDTITSLKAQVNFLQKRASVLQEDLDACRSRR